MVYRVFSVFLTFSNRIDSVWRKESISLFLYRFMLMLYIISSLDFLRIRQVEQHLQ